MAEPPEDIPKLPPRTYSSDGADPNEPLDETADHQRVDESTEASEPVGSGDASPGLDALPTIPGHDVLGFVAKGGMGYVLKARHRVLDRIVAVKLPLHTGSMDSQFRERFVREARAAAKLKHPQICPIYEVGESEDRPFIVMDFIPGESLGTWFKEESPTARQSAEIIAQLAATVQFAHEKGVLHRDIKPANVVMHAETRLPVLMDFGLAKETDDQDSQLTQDGQVMGTPAYMAPEQAAGKIDQLGPATDIYSLGAVLYHLLCGRPPFEGTVGEVLRLVQTEEPRSPRSVAPRLHRDLETICLKAMAKAPADRYPTAAALVEDLERFSAGDAILARPLSAPQRLIRSVRRHPVTWSTVAGATLLLTVSVVLAWWAIGAANRAASDRHVGELESVLDRETQTGDWSEQRLRQLGATVQELQSLSEDRASVWQQQITERLADSVEAAVRRANLSEQDAAAISTTIDLLRSRDPSRADELRASLRARIARWENLLLVEAPLSTLPPEIPAGITLRDGMIRAVGDDDVLVRQVEIPTPSEGRVELEVHFGKQWTTARQLGLGLNTRDRSGYRFMLDIPGHGSPEQGSDSGQGDSGQGDSGQGDSGQGDSGLASSPSFGAVIADGEPLRLTLWRDTVRIKRWELLGLDRDALALRVRREAGQLSVLVNGSQQFTYADLFPLPAHDPGTFAMFLPAQVDVALVRAAHRLLPLNPRPLETADDLFNRGEFEEALRLYEAVEETALPRDPRQELLVKRALCQFELKQESQAQELMSRVMGEEGDRWPPLAACRLWIYYLTKNDQQAADSVMQILSAHYGFGEVGAVLPEQLRRQILSRYDAGISRIDSLIKYDPDRLRDIERLVEVRSLLGEASTIKTALLLIHAYRLEDQLDKALEVARREAERGSIPGAVEYLDVLSQSGELQLAESELVRLRAANDTPDHASWMLVEARLAGAQGEWHRALQVTVPLYQWSEDSEQLSPNRDFYVRAMLLHGLAYLKMGYPAKAREVWRQATQAIRGLTPKPSTTLNQTDFYRFVLFSLAGELNERDIAETMGRFISNELVQTSRLLVSHSEIASTSNRAWASPRGLALAEDIGVDRLALRDRVLLPLTLIAHAYLKPRSFNAASDAQDQLLWDSSAEMLKGVLQTEKLQMPQLLMLALAFKGQEGFTGWGGVAGGLDPDLRAAMAYVLAHRYQRLKKEGSSIEKRLDEALKYAPPNSPILALAQTDKQLLAEKMGRVLLDNPSRVPMQVEFFGAGEPKTLQLETQASIDLSAGEYQLRIKSDEPVLMPMEKLRVVPMVSYPITAPESAWRTAARALLAKGADVTLLNEEGKTIRLTGTDALLPRGPHEIRQISGAGAKISDSDLALMRPLSHLGSAYFSASSSLSSWGIRHLENHAEMTAMSANGVELDSALAAFFNSRLNLSTLGIDGPGPRTAIRELKPSIPLQYLLIPASYCDQALLGQLRQWEGLRSLTVYGAELDLQFVEGLVELPKLDELTLGVPLSPELLRRLPPKLRLIHSNHASTVIDASHVEAMRHLTDACLQITRGSISEEGKAALAAARSPRELWLTGDTFDEDQARAIAGLRSNWYVRWNDVVLAMPSGDRETLADCQALDGVVSVFSGQSRNPVVAPPLADSDTLVRVYEVKFNNQPQLHSDLLARLAQCRSLEVLGASESPISDEDVKLFAGSQLNTVDFRRSPLSDAAVDHLRAMRNLTSADIRGTEITAEGVRRLLEVHPLRRLYLSPSQWTAEVAQQLRRQRIRIGFNLDWATDDHLQLLADQPAVHGVHLIAPKKISAAGLSQLPPSVQFLRVGWSDDPFTVEQLSGLKHLPSLHLVCEHLPLAEGLLDAIAKMPNVQRLELVTMEVSDEQIARLRNARPSLLVIRR